MDLSIVIINWNTRDMLRDCLESVARGLEGVAAETFVVDNASTDGSADMVEMEFPGVRLIRNARNMGFAAANNQAIRRAAGDFVLLLNSDTLVHGDVLARSVRYMRDNPGVGVMGCRVLNRDGTTQVSCTEFPSVANLVLQTTGLAKLPWPRVLGKYRMAHFDRLSERDVEVVSGCYMMVRSAALERVGLLDESFFFFGEETDWCRRFREAGWRVAFAPVGTITHFGGGSSGSLNYRRDLLLTEGTVRLHRKHGGWLPAAGVWALLLAFGLTRAAYWALAFLLSRRPAALSRSRHFVQVVRHFAAAWPSGGARA
ncbi:MAG TPA: glycosyltransferase family 2 protein [Azospirillaceae bacterium]|nr:glycosyltransferase family 2 protein [Azospirillaceae bacterium]